MKTMLTGYAGTVRGFRAWLRGQSGQRCRVVGLAEWREKRKAASAKAVCGTRPIA